MARTAEELIAALGLVPLEDEGGWRRTTSPSAPSTTF